VTAPDTERLAPAALRDLQEERFAAQWDHVRRRSAFYRAKLGAVCDRALDLEGLAGIAETDKDELRASQLAAGPFGDYLACDPDDLVRVHRTSGMTGKGMTLGFTARDAAVIAAVGARAMRAAGLRPSDRVIHCLNYQLWTGGVTDHLILEAAGATVVPFGVGNTVGLVETIRELGVTAISCTPSYPALIERVLRDELGLEPRDLGLRIALFGGEAGLDDREFRRRLEETWGFAVRNANFGLSEVLSILGSQCEHTDDLHFHAGDVVFAEILDPATRERLPIEEGVTGELVCTHLLREAQPLVRYGCRDRVTVTGTGPCACGRTAWRFRIAGRTDDMFNVRGVNVFPTAVRAVVAAHPRLATGELRIELHGGGPYDRIVLRVEAARGLDPSAHGRAAATLTEAIKRSIGASAAVTVVPYGAIERTAHKTSWIERYP
jgi:phenylacetate-CoA ligase